MRPQILLRTPDFFVTKYDTLGNKIWTRQLGVSAKSTNGSDVATDATGNIFVAGATYGGLDGNTFLGNQSSFLTKYDATGAKQWTKLLGGGIAYTYGDGVATDSSNNIFVAGYTTGGLNGNSLTGTQDFFLIKYDTGGNVLWTRQLGVSGLSTSGSDVAIDLSNNAFVTGQTFGGLDGNALTGSKDFFLTKYDNSGSKQWTRQMGVFSVMTYGSGVTTDLSGNVLVTGNTGGSLDGVGLTGTCDMFLIKYNSSGTKQWTKLLGATAKATYGWNITTDAFANIYVLGTTTGGLNNNILTGTQDFFLAKYNSAGVWQWTKQMGAPGKTLNAGGITSDASGNITLNGSTPGGLDGNSSMGATDSFVVQYQTP